MHRPSPQPDAPALLLLHGHPQNYLIWHRVIAQLDVTQWNVVVTDIRGRGGSSIPIVSPSAEPLGAESQRYSKRTMARDNVELMRSLGYPLRHRARSRRPRHTPHAGGSPRRLRKAIILDIAPTLDLYTHTEPTFAKMYWHWFFLIQPQPLPEQFISAQPLAYLQACMSKFDPDASIFTDWATASHLDGMRTEQQAHALAEDYPTSAPGGIDLTLDARDRKDGKRIRTPVHLLWGSKGVIGRLYHGALDSWRLPLDHVDGHAVDAGHYIPEERPEDVVKGIPSFV